MAPIIFVNNHVAHGTTVLVGLEVFLCASTLILSRNSELEEEMELEEKCGYIIKLERGNMEVLQWRCTKSKYLE